MAERETVFVESRDGVELREVISFSDEDIEDRCRQVDIAAGELREILIPPGKGIELTYAEKRREAVEFMARNPQPDEYGEYPFLEMDAEVDGVTVQQAAIAILTRSEAFRLIGPIIEGMRRAAKNALATERNPAKVRVIVNDVSEAKLIEKLKTKHGMSAEKIALIFGT